MDDDQNLTIYANDQKVAEGKDTAYTCGVLGLLAWSSQAQFKDIKYSVTDKKATSDITNFNPISAAFVETGDG